jgi:hypothetical protein
MKVWKIQDGIPIVGCFGVITGQRRVFGAAREITVRKAEGIRQEAIHTYQSIKGDIGGREIALWDLLLAAQDPLATFMVACTERWPEMRTCLAAAGAALAHRHPFFVVMGSGTCDLPVAVTITAIKAGSYEEGEARIKAILSVWKIRPRRR